MRKTLPILLVMASSAFAGPIPTPVPGTGNILYKSPSTGGNVAASGVTVRDPNGPITVNGSAVVTTSSLTVKSANPWRFNNTTAGLELQGINGTWDMPSTLTLNGAALPNPYGTYDIGTLTGTLVLTPDNRLVFTLPYGIQRLTEFGVFVDSGAVPAEAFLEFKDTTTTPPLRKAVITNLGYFKNQPDSATAYSTYGESTDVHNAITARTGDIRSILGAIWAGAPVGGGLSWGVAGSVNAFYALIKTAVHCEGNLYAVNLAAVGYGREQKVPNGHFQISTWGDGQSCTSGSQVLDLYTDPAGTHFAHNTVNPVNYGSNSRVFGFDCDIMTSGGLYTSNTIYMAGSPVLSSTTAIPSTLGTATSTVGTVGTGETQLLEIKVPNGSFSSSGQRIAIACGGSMVSGATKNERVRVYYGASGGGTLIFDSGSVSLASSGDWRVEGEVYRSGSSAQVSSIGFSSSTATTFNYTTAGTAAVSNSTDEYIRVTGTSTGVGAANNDTTLKNGSVILWP